MTLYADRSFGIKSTMMSAVRKRIVGGVVDDVGPILYTFVPDYPVTMSGLRFTGGRSPAFTQVHDPCSGGNENDPADGTCIRAWLRLELAAVWGTEQGPVRLLDVSLSSLALPDRLAVVLRFLRRETEFLNGGGQLTQGHHRLLAQAWNRSCEQFTVDQRAEVRAAAPTEVWMDFAGCP